MLLSEFVDCFGNFEEQEFLRRFSHPFLLAAPNADEADRGRPVYLVRRGGESGIIVGRGARCHIQIKDPLVSTRHAELLPPKQKDGTWRLVDRGSTNKTYLGEEALEPDVPVDIENGCELTFGLNSRYQFLMPAAFRDVVKPLFEEELKGRAEFKTDVLGSVDELRDRAAVEREDAPEEPALPVEGELLLFCDSLDPTPLKLGKRLIIGRSASHADMVLPSKQVSRRHAELDRRGDGIYARDMGSSNGTRIGTRKIGGSWVRLPLATPLKVGEYLLTVDRPQRRGGSSAQLLPGTELLQRGATPEQGVTSDLADQPLGELLQQIEEDKLSGLLRVVSEGLKGQVGFSEGLPLYAATSGGAKMEAAIRELLKVKQGSCVVLEKDQAGAERKMQRSFSEIILEEFLDQ